MTFASARWIYPNIAQDRALIIPERDLTEEEAKEALAAPYKRIKDIKGFGKEEAAH